jgi:hypothetical protein
VNLRDRLAALLGLSAYAAPPPGGMPTLDDPRVKQIREKLNGQITPLPQTRTRWYMRDVETGIQLADGGDLTIAGQLYRAMRRDGTLSGLLSTRTSGLVSLPKRFYGDSMITKDLSARNGTRSVFDDMLPPAELALLAADGVEVGVGVGELLPVKNRPFPVLVRLEPEWLRYRWSENRWYYLSIAGPIPITPGDGRWVLHVPGGRLAPWQHGLWQACGTAWINKQHAQQHRANWESKLANPARVAVSPQGASEMQKQSWFRAVMAWGINTVFGLTPGYDVKLLESNGRGYESFQETINDANLEMTIALAGQTVTTDGGTGFANADVHKSIRADLIKSDAESLAYTVNTQMLPSYIASRWGEAALDVGTTVEWDVTPPKDLKAAAESMNQLGQAIASLTQALAPLGETLDVVQLANRFGIPLARVSDSQDETVDINDDADGGGEQPGQVLQ